MADLVRVGGSAASRHVPARLANTTLLRGRLVSDMRGRFDRRLTVVEAGAGFGKSTLLAQAFQENQIEQLGTDVLVRLVESDQDPSRLIESLIVAVDAADGPPETAVDRLADAVWALAPSQVALTFDDAHRLGEATASWAVLRSLLERLPSNGHVVVCGRRAPLLPVARYLSRDDALVITEADLGFTDDELAEVAALRSIAPDLVADLPRWPALATLTGVVGRSASLDYLWDEVLHALPVERQRLLAAAAPFGEIDDDLVRALGGTITAEALVDGLPLVDVTDEGAFRLHDLWADAVAVAATDEERRDALRAGGAMLLERGELRRAAEAFSLAGDEAGFSRVLLAFARRPTGHANSHEVMALHSLVPPSMRDSPGGRYIEAARYHATDDRQAAAVFARAEDAARAQGDVEIEVLAHWRCSQFTDLDGMGGPPLTDRLIELADAGVPLARGVRAFIESRYLQCAGDARGSRQALVGLDDFDPEQRDMSMAIRLVDLGRPEDVGATLEEVLASGISDIYRAQAVWMQGEIDPSLAWPIARELPSRKASVPAMTRIGLHGVVTTMGVAAGRHQEVAALSQANVAQARGTAVLMELLAEVADGLVELCVDGEDVAVATFTRLLDRVPLGRWPERPYLYALTVIRGLLPGGEVLDRCEMGPSLTVAVQAGAALAAVRAGDAGPAAALPWDKPNLLRVHVQPPLLAELALAAGSTPGAPELLASVPDLRVWLRRIVDRGRTGTGMVKALGKQAALLAQSLPARPDHDVRIDVLGGLSIERSDGVAVEGWDRRERVRHLLAYLALRRNVARAEVASELWPDLPSDKAAANLRVNLHHLQRALQPERSPDDPPWFLQSDGARLWLCDDGVTIDAELADAAMADAVRAEASGLPSDALRHYARVAELTEGELLSDIDAEWVVYERMRLRSVAHAASARQGELVLARGEPEEALRLATKAQRLDPLSERAHRLAIRCHLALGSTSSARAAARSLREVLDDAGLAPEHESQQLLARLEHSVPVSR